VDFWPQDYMFGNGKAGNAAGHCRSLGQNRSTMRPARAGNIRIQAMSWPA
jgi:hypothetical protein